MKLTMSSQRRGPSAVCWTGTCLGGLQADYKKNDKTLDWQPAYGDVAGSYSAQRQARLTDVGPQSDC